jgi:polyamine oxidase
VVSWRRSKPATSFFDGVPAGAASSVDPKVIVIGAGAAGLSAARVLRDAGCEVVVVEGRDRVGGRTNTITVGGGVVDEGANWVHNGPSNPICRLAAEAGLELSEDNPVNPLALKAFDKVSGQRVHPVKLISPLVRSGLVLYKYGKESLSATHREHSLAERFDREIGRARGETNRRYFRSLLRTLVDLAAAKEADHLDPRALALNPTDITASDSVITGGFRGLVERLADGLEIRLGTSVEAIRYHDDGVSVVTTNGTHNGSHVIVTVPLGVLKAQTITFDPPLPAAKLRGIDNVGVGVVEKVILTFDEPFWRAKLGKPRSLLYISDVPGDFPAFVDSSTSAGCPTLVAFLTGQQAEDMAEDQQPFIERAGEVLQEIFPDTYRAPTAVHVTGWGVDPFSLGSYSAPTIGVSVDDYEQLAAPVAGRVLFAGEATYREHAGFVEGAIGSGIREARRILGRDVDLAVSSSPPTSRHMNDRTRPHQGDES